MHEFSDRWEEIPDCNGPHMTKMTLADFFLRGRQSHCMVHSGLDWVKLSLLLNLQGVPKKCFAPNVWGQT